MGYGSLVDTCLQETWLERPCIIHADSVSVTEDQYMHLNLMQKKMVELVIEQLEEVHEKAIRHGLSETDIFVTLYDMENGLPYATVSRSKGLVII